MKAGKHRAGAKANKKILLPGTITSSPIRWASGNLHCYDKLQLYLLESDLD
jgi:hypothetical protein